MEVQLVQLAWERMIHARLMVHAIANALSVRLKGLRGDEPFLELD